MDPDGVARIRVPIKPAGVIVGVVAQRANIGEIRRIRRSCNGCRPATDGQQASPSRLPEGCFRQPSWCSSQRRPASCCRRQSLSTGRRDQRWHATDRIAVGSYRTDSSPRAVTLSGKAGLPLICCASLVSMCGHRRRLRRRCRIISANVLRRPASERPASHRPPAYRLHRAP